MFRQKNMMSNLCCQNALIIIQNLQQIFENGFAPPPLLNNVQKTADLVEDGTPKGPPCTNLQPSHKKRELFLQEQCCVINALNDWVYYSVDCRDWRNWRNWRDCRYCLDCRDCIDWGSEKVSLTHLLTTRKQEMLAHLKLTGNLVKKHIADKLGH